MSTHRSLLKSAGIVGGLTGVSRVLGFVRDLIIATAFGTGIGAEAFVVSFRIPNLLRDLVGEGAANAAFVPVLTECRLKRPNEFWRLVSTLFVLMGAILLALSLLGVLFAPQIVGLLAPGFMAEGASDKLELTIRLTRTIFPYIFLIGLSALAMGVLNSLHEFASSALGPILLNISMIAAGFFFERTYGPMALVMGVLLGGVLQLACQIPPLLKRGFRWESPYLKDASLSRIGKLLVPRAAGSAIYQINIFADSILASFSGIVGPGGQSALYYANRLFQLPLAVFGLAIAQAALPTFTAQMADKDMRSFRETFSMAVRSLLLLVVPASVGLGVWAGPIIRIIFERGRFDAYSTSITSSALFFYAFGLLSCCLVKLLVNAFYAMHDTRTPVKTMFFTVLLNVALSLLFMGPLKIGGLALASTLSVSVNVALLYRRLSRVTGDLDEARIVRSFVRILAAACAMGSAAWAYGAGVLEAVRGAGPLAEGSLLLAGILLSVGVYVIVAMIFRVEEMSVLIGRLLKRLKR